VLPQGPPAPGAPGLFGFHRGPGATTILPTLYTPQTAPRTVETARDARQRVFVEFTVVYGVLGIGLAFPRVVAAGVRGVAKVGALAKAKALKKWPGPSAAKPATPAADPAAGVPKESATKPPAASHPVPKAPMALLPNGRSVPPSHFGGGYTAPGAGDPRTMEEVFANGRPARGNDRRLLEHAQPASEVAKPELGGTAFRGTTPSPASFAEAGQGAADWAPEGGIIYEVRHVPTWPVEEVLHGQIPDPHGGYSGKLHVRGELEGAIPAEVPADCIVRAGVVSENASGKHFVKPGDWTPNPNYRPR